MEIVIKRSRAHKSVCHFQPGAGRRFLLYPSSEETGFPLLGRNGGDAIIDFTALNFNATSRGGEANERPRRLHVRGIPFMGISSGE